jgi:hypothetical protein
MAHSANCRAVAEGFDMTAIAVKDAIRRNDLTAEAALTKSAALLVGATFENRLKRVATEPGGFTDSELVQIRRGSVIDQWSNAIDIGFRRRYNRWELTEASLGREQSERRLTMLTSLESHFRPLVEMRNTLAHGQWASPLNSKETHLNPVMAARVVAETIESLSIKQRVGWHFEGLVGDLVSTAVAFERDFAQKFVRLTQALESLARSDYATYRSRIQESARRGAAYRMAGLTPPSTPLR